MGRCNIATKAMHTYGLNSESTLPITKDVVTHVKWVIERYNHTTIPAKIIQQMSTATVQCLQACTDFGCQAVFLLYYYYARPIKCQKNFFFSFIPCILLSLPHHTPFCFLPLSSSSSSILKQSSTFCHSLTFFSHLLFSHVHSISENNAMVEKTDHDIVVGSGS